MFVLLTRADMSQRMVAEGHQVASHTWSHENASAITAAQFQDQILWNEIAFNDILGMFPTYMRFVSLLAPESIVHSRSNVGVDHLTPSASLPAKQPSPSWVTTSYTSTWTPRGIFSTTRL